MIKKLTFILLAASCMQSMYSQNTEKNEKFLENKTLFEELTNVKKKQDKFNLFLNMQGSFDANFRNGFEGSVVILGGLTFVNSPLCIHLC